MSDSWAAEIAEKGGWPKPTSYEPAPSITAHIDPTCLARDDSAARGTPPYYRLADGLDVLDVAMNLGLDVARANALKYVVRSGRKPGEPEAKDLEKAIECLRRRVEWLRSRRG